MYGMEDTTSLITWTRCLLNLTESFGLNRLKAIHLNNSQNEIGSHKDRHATLVSGKIPLEALVRIINHPALRHLPFYLETPNELPGYAKEIQLMREMYREI